MISISTVCSPQYAKTNDALAPKKDLPKGHPRRVALEHS
jgi:hypothetical protein